MRRALFLIPLISCIGIALAQNPTQESAPTRLPHVAPQMLNAGYWISEHPSPDKIVMSLKQITDFNLDVRDHLGLTKDIFSLIDHFKTESLLDTFNRNLKDITDHQYYSDEGTNDDADFIDKVKSNMHLTGVVMGVAAQYALLVHYANQRFLPTEKGLYEKRGDIDFDELQNSALDVGTPVAIVHQSLDRKWYYVLSALSDGWVEADNLVIADEAQVKNFTQAGDYIVVTAPRADIFLDDAMMSFDDFVRMGVKLPLVAENDGQWIVQVPVRNKEGQLQLTKGYIPKTQAHHGYLPYTARTIYNQAFFMLDKPYGWGDMYGQQDCSRFLQMVYATVGVELPRDSKDQAQVGEEIASFDEKAGSQQKLDVLKNTQGATTILPMKGHIMLYLGMNDGIPFAIHETSGYSKTVDDLQMKYVLNRVVVSDLSLGEDSAKGSLLRRLTKIVAIQ